MPFIYPPGVDIRKGEHIPYAAEHRDKWLQKNKGFKFLLDIVKNISHPNIGIKQQTSTNIENIAVV